MYSWKISSNHTCQIIYQKIEIDNALISTNINKQQNVCKSYA